MKDARGTTKKLLENSSKITPSLAQPGPARPSQGPETIEFYYHFWPFETCVVGRRTRQVGLPARGKLREGGGGDEEKREKQRIKWD